MGVRVVSSFLQEPNTIHSRKIVMEILIQICGWSDHGPGLLFNDEPGLFRIRKKQVARSPGHFLSQVFVGFGRRLPPS